MLRASNGSSMRYRSQATWACVFIGLGILASCGSGTERASSNQTGALGIAVDSSAVYWTNSFSDKIMKRAK
jgi:hypothetical protein